MMWIKKDQILYYFFVFSYAVLEGKYFVLSGKEWKEKLGGAFKQDVGSQKEITGNTAFPGKARGLAKIIFTADDTPKCREATY